MNKLIVYPSLEGALGDIDFTSGGKSWQAQINFSDGDWIDGELESLFNRFNNFLESKNFGYDWKGDTLRIVAELAKNAYKASVRKQGDSFRIYSYAGTRGVLMGLNKKGIS